MKAEHLNEAAERCQAALHHTSYKPVFLFYYTAILFAQNKSKEALLQLENAMSLAPKFLKKLIDLYPNVLQNGLAVDIISRFKKSKSRRRNDRYCVCKRCLLPKNIREKSWTQKI
jgi:predicted Zn-dependent protease